MQSCDSASVNQLLLSRMEELCLYLLPNGKAKGNHWVVGGIEGEAGASLQVTMSGSAAGRFIDFADKDSKGATPLWLWSKVRHVSFSTAIREAKDWLGVKDENFGVKRHKPKSYAKAHSNGIRAIDANTPIMDYLVGERRLDPIVVAASKISETDDGKAIVFNFADYDEEKKGWITAHRKFLRLERPDGKKDTWTTKGTKRCLYGKNLITENDSELVICEGEIDALSWNSWKIPAVSIPNGVSDFEWVDVDWEWLARFEKIYVSTDMDEPGRGAALEICKRLGLHRCYIVTLPKKDANDCLVSGLTREQMLKSLADAKGIELDEIKRPEDFKSEVMDYYTTDPSLRGTETPWSQNLPWRVRKGELTILSGFSGHGKALSLDTKIPTPKGWTTMGALFPGDQVFDENGKACNVTFATPVQMDRKCYEVLFSDGTTVIADAEHLWETWSCHARNSHARSLKRGTLKPKGTDQSSKRVKPRIVNTSEIASSIYETRWSDEKRLNHAIPVAGKLDLPPSDLSIDPYCLGAWLGDGDSSGYGFTCGNGDEDILAAFSAAGFEVSKHSVPENKCPHYGILGFKSYLDALNLTNNKHIPQSYLRSSVDQRIALMQGLMDTDGCITQYGRCEFTSMLEALADGVYELATSLGIRATKTTGEASVNGVKCGTKYRIFFTTSLPVFRLDRKLCRISSGVESRRRYRYIVQAREVPSVPVKCITVDSPSHLYLCSEAMIPTHNTAGLNQLMLHLVSKNLKVMDASLEIKPGMTLYNMTRCALGKKYSEKPEIEGCINWINDAMFFLDCIGTVNVTRLMQAMEYARKRHGIDVFVIDSLFKCGLSGEDYAGARDFVDKLTTFCNNTGAHVILVAHSRKTQNGNEYSVPTKSDVAGSSDITNAAFNIIIFWRNKMKKKKMDEIQNATDMDPITKTEQLVKWMDQPDGQIVIDKQRFGEGEECAISVFFHKESCQFHTTQGLNMPYFVQKA